MAKTGSSVIEPVAATWRHACYNDDMEQTTGGNLAEFLKARRAALGMEPKAVARRAGLHPSAIYRYEGGERGEAPKQQTLEKLARGYDVQVEQLRSILLGEHPLPTSAPESYEDLLERARMVAPIRIPVVEHPAHAGHGGSPILDYVYIERPRVTGQDLVCVPVVGDCMMPKIEEGDRVIVARATWPEPGQMVLAVYDERVIVRRFYQTDSHVVLRAENPAYADLEVTEVDIIGVVLEIRRLP